MFLRFFNSLARSRYLFRFSLTFIFAPRFVVIVRSTWWKVLFFYVRSNLDWMILLCVKFPDYYYYYYYCLFLLCARFLTPVFAVFHWSLGDSKSPQDFTMLLSILLDFNHVMLWWPQLFLWSSFPLSHFSRPLETVPSAPTVIGITVTFIVHSFFSLLGSIYLHFFKNFLL